MNSDDVIKSSVLRVPDESESVFCKCTWRYAKDKLEWKQDMLWAINIWPTGIYRIASLHYNILSLFTNYQVTSEAPKINPWASIVSLYATMPFSEIWTLRDFKLQDKTFLRRLHKLSISSQNLYQVMKFDVLLRSHHVYSNNPKKDRQ